MLDPVAVERAEREIDRFILKRNRERSEANRIESAWAESERAHAAIADEHLDKADALAGPESGA